MEMFSGRTRSERRDENDAHDKKKELKGLCPLGGKKKRLCLTWSSTDEHWLGAVCRTEIDGTHHVVHLRVHIQLDHVGVPDD